MTPIGTDGRGQGVLCAVGYLFIVTETLRTPPLEIADNFITAGTLFRNSHHPSMMHSPDAGIRTFTKEREYPDRRLDAGGKTLLSRFADAKLLTLSGGGLLF